MLKLGNSLRLITSVAASILIMSSLAGASELVGLVTDQNQQFVNGADIVVTDSNGNQVAEGRTDLYGRYCISIKDPGTYTVSIDVSNFQGGSTTLNLGADGSVVDWTLSQNSPAKNDVKPGNVSMASASCGGAFLGTNAALLAPIGVIGAAGIGLGVAGGVGAFNGANNPPPPPSPSM